VCGDPRLKHEGVHVLLEDLIHRRGCSFEKSGVAYLRLLVILHVTMGEHSSFPSVLLSRIRDHPLFYLAALDPPGLQNRSYHWHPTA
jgi:hypothetical protein